jgi:hypothetical protein
MDGSGPHACTTLYCEWHERVVTEGIRYRIRVPDANPDAELIDFGGGASSAGRARAAGQIDTGTPGSPALRKRLGVYKAVVGLSIACLSPRHQHGRWRSLPAAPASALLGAEQRSSP